MAGYGDAQSYIETGVMRNYRIIRIIGGSGYKVHVTTASSGLRVIGVFSSEADAMHWIAADQESGPLAQRQGYAGVALLDRG
jgi:hypothetical protein